MSQRTKRKKIITISTIVGVAIIALFAAYFAPLRTEITVIPMTETEKEASDAYGIVHGYVVASPTFAYDGDVSTLIVEYVGSTKSIPPQHMFRASFDSSHGGFGNREGQMLTQVITPHTMEVSVVDGTVISAVTDDVWDEMNHQYVLKTGDLQSRDGVTMHPDENATDYDFLISAIKSHGSLVLPIEEIDDSFFSVPTKVISVDDEIIQVFEFENNEAALDASRVVSPDGTEIGTSIIRWVDAPHFYTNGKIIVLYVGQNPELVDLLESLLGTQFAGM